MREAIARLVYAAMQTLSDEGQQYPWVEGGNATAQDEARRAADQILALMPAPRVRVVDRWFVVKADGGVRPNPVHHSSLEVARSYLALWDREFPQDAPHRVVQLAYVDPEAVETTRGLVAERPTSCLTLVQRITQTKLHTEDVNGNCTAACLATVFGGTIEEYEARIPFTARWWEDVEAIFRERGLLVLRLSPDGGYPTGVCFVAGNSPRGVRHLCVMQDGAIVHDPHPSQAGLVEITDYWAVIPWTFHAALADADAGVRV
ncbi:hypothetical protein [Gemmatimonas sp.]